MEFLVELNLIHLGHPTCKVQFYEPKKQKSQTKHNPFPPPSSDSECCLTSYLLALYAYLLHFVCIKGIKILKDEIY